MCLIIIIIMGFFLKKGLDKTAQLALCLCLKDLSEWVSGDHGFIVFTLGSAISDMPEEITSTFLETFRQIPQKVHGTTMH